MKNTEKMQIGFDTLFTEIANATRKTKLALTGLKTDNALQVVYIAGKVTGLPYAEAQAMFKTRENELLAKGYTVINPCNIISPDEDWNTAMMICLQLLPLADYISLLDNWTNSRGARWEWNTAKRYQITTLHL